MGNQQLLNTEEQVESKVPVLPEESKEDVGYNKVVENKDPFSTVDILQQPETRVVSQADFDKLINSTQLPQERTFIPTEENKDVREQLNAYTRMNLISTKFPGKTIKEITLSCIPEEASIIDAIEDGVVKKKAISSIVAVDWEICSEPYLTTKPPEAYDGFRRFFWSKDKGLPPNTTADEEKNIPFEQRNLTVKTVSIEMSDEEILYSRFRRYMLVTVNGGKKVTVGPWSAWAKIDGSINGMQLSETLVRTPLLDVKLDFDNSEAGNLVINLSDFAMFSGPGKHSSTTYRIIDNLGNLVFERIKDKDNLLGINVPYEKFKFSRNFEIMAKFHTDKGGESNWAKRCYTNRIGDSDLFNATLDYGIVLGKKVYVSVHAFTEKFSHVDLEVRTEDGLVVKKIYGVYSKQIIFDTEGLESNTMYSIYGRVYTKDGYVSGWKLIKTTIAIDSDYYNYKKNLKYLNRFVFQQELVTGGNTVICTKQGFTGTILFTRHNSRTLNRYVMRGGKLLDQGVVYEFKDVIELPFLNVIPLPNDDVILNYCLETAEDYRKSVFVYLQYNHFKQNYTETARLVRENERFSTALTNSVAVDPLNGDVYYIPGRELENKKETTLKIYKLNTQDPTKLEVEKFSNLPFEANRFVNLTWTHDRRLLVYNGCTKMVVEKGTGTKKWSRQNDVIYAIDIETKISTAICTIPERLPKDVYCLQAFLRRDDTVVAFNAVADGRRVKDELYMLIKYNPKNSFAEVYENKLNEEVPFRTSLLLNNGDIVRVSSTDHDPQKVFRYCCASANPDDVYDDEHAKRMEKVLVVRSGKTISIEDPSIYDSIIINGNSPENTGKLKVLSRDYVCEYTYKDKIFTRSIVVSQAEYDRWCSMYNTVLWGEVELIVEPNNEAEEFAKYPVLGFNPTPEQIKDNIKQILDVIKTKGYHMVTENNYHIQIRPKPNGTDADGNVDVDISYTNLLTGEKSLVLGRVTTGGELIDKNTGDVIYPKDMEDAGFMYFEVYKEDDAISVITAAIKLLRIKPNVKDNIARLVTTDQLDVQEIKELLCDMLKDPRKLENTNVLINLRNMVVTLGGEDIFKNL